MKILMLSWNFPPVRGGIEDVVANLLEGLRAAGHEVRVITAHVAQANDPPAVIRASRPGVRAFLLAAVGRGLALARVERPDVVLCGSVVAAPAAWVLRQRFGVPYLVLVHGTDVVRGGRLHRWAVRWLLRRAARIASNSANTLRLLEKMGLPAERVDVIHPGVWAERFAPAALAPDRAELPEAEGRRILLTVGRLVRRKGVLPFVEHVMPALVSQVPEVLLVVVGDDPIHSLAHSERLRGRIEQRVRELNLQDHVALLGEVSEKRLLGLFARADLFVLPCLDLPDDIEGFGIVFIEAGLAGTPSVATGVGGIPEAVEDGRTGILVAPGDHAAMLQVIRELLADEPRRRALGEAAAARGRAQFDWPIIVRQYQRSLERCVESHERAH